MAENKKAFTFLLSPDMGRRLDAAIKRRMLQGDRFSKNEIVQFALEQWCTIDEVDESFSRSKTKRASAKGKDEAAIAQAEHRTRQRRHAGAA